MADADMPAPTPNSSLPSDTLVPAHRVPMLKIAYIPMEKLRPEGRDTDALEVLSDSDCADDSGSGSDSDGPDECDAPMKNSHRSRALVYASRLGYKKRLHSAKTEKDMWDIVHELMYARRRLNTIPVMRLFMSFRSRMNPQSPLPDSFNANVLLCHQMESDSIPRHTTDQTADQVFSSPFTEEEIAGAKAHLHKRSAENSSSGLDGVGYGALMEIDNDVLAKLFNECLDTLEVPTEWLTTALSAILKKGKARDDPEGYRAIALESCGLKFMTLLIHKRLTRWCEKNDIIPDSQNGFREGYRTNDNVFILRAAVEQARAEGKTLYVAFADLSNAFPATNHACLWAKLRRLGAGGKIFDWLRLLYQEMTYTVRHAGETSEQFKAAMGILAGDTSSPILWTIYLSDLIFDPCADDIRLSGHPIASLEQADDIILMSTTLEGLQKKMMALHRWCAGNAMFVNATKSAVLIFGPRPMKLPCFHFGEDPVEIKKRQVYVGVHIMTEGKDMFSNHYTFKFVKATTVGNIVLGIHKMLGSLDPWDARKLYMGLVDPHLIHACDVIVDTASSAKLLGMLEDLLKNLIRRILGVHSRSFIAILFSETGIVPLRYRHILLALIFLGYLLTLPSHRYARLALDDSINLLASGKAGWFSDLLNSLQTLPIPVNVTDPLSINKDAIEKISKMVRASMEQSIMRDIDRIPSLYLLRGRLESGEKDAPPRVVPIKFRHYLSIVTYCKHRVALTRLITGCHALAVERLKWIRDNEGQRIDVDRSARLCRFCRAKTESPEHATLECNANADLISIRREFWEKVHQLPQRPFPPMLLHAPSLAKQLQEIIAYKPAIRLVARLVYRSLAVYKTEPVYIPMATQPHTV